MQTRPNLWTANRDCRRARDDPKNTTDQTAQSGPSPRQSGGSGARGPKESTVDPRVTAETTGLCLGDVDGTQKGVKEGERMPLCSVGTC